MSTEYSFHVAVGYEVSFKELARGRLKRLREKSRLEDRFDPRTGKKTGQEKVVEREAGTYLVIGDDSYSIEFEDVPEAKAALETALSLALGTELELTDVNESPYVDLLDSTYVVAPPCLMPRESREVDLGRATGTGAFLVSELVKAMPAPEAFGQRLRKAGVPAGGPGVRRIGGCDG